MPDWRVKIDEFWFLKCSRLDRKPGLIRPEWSDFVDFQRLEGQFKCIYVPNMVYFSWKRSIVFDARADSFIFVVYRARRWTDPNLFCIKENQTSLLNPWVSQFPKGMSCHFVNCSPNNKNNNYDNYNLIINVLLEILGRAFFFVFIYFLWLSQPFWNSMLSMG